MIATFQGSHQGNQITLDFSYIAKHCKTTGDLLFELSPGQSLEIRRVVEPEIKDSEAIPWSPGNKWL